MHVFSHRALWPLRHAAKFSLGCVHPSMPSATRLLPPSPAARTTAHRPLPCFPVPDKVDKRMSLFLHLHTECTQFLYCCPFTTLASPSTINLCTRPCATRMSAFSPPNQTALPPPLASSALPCPHLPMPLTAFSSMQLALLNCCIHIAGLLTIEHLPCCALWV